jgi:hypothetical protein
MNSNAVAASQVEATIQLPSGFEIEEMQIGDGTILFRGRNADGSSKIMLFDASSGEPRGIIQLK